MVVLFSSGCVFMKCVSTQACIVVTYMYAAWTQWFRFDDDAIHKAS